MLLGSSEKTYTIREGNKKYTETGKHINKQ